MNNTNSAVQAQAWRLPSHAELVAARGGRSGPQDTACPICGPDRRSPLNRGRRVLRTWDDRPGGLGFCCARCGATGWVRDGGHAGALSQRRRSIEPKAVTTNADAARTAKALLWWREARDPRDTLVEQYLAQRGLTLPIDIAGRVIRFHPHLWYADTKGHLPGMVAVFRDIHTDEPCGIHRTFLTANGGKVGRKMMGRVRGAAIKLTADEDISYGLHVGEGLETCIAGYIAGFQPTWALGSAGAIGDFPVLAAIDALTILAERDDHGANERAITMCASRWLADERDVYAIDPIIGGDMADVWREAVR